MRGRLLGYKVATKVIMMKLSVNSFIHVRLVFAFFSWVGNVEIDSRRDGTFRFVNWKCKYGNFRYTQK